MKLAASILLCAWILQGQQPEPSAAPSIDEQQDLMRAVSEGTSPVDLIRALEAHLAKYPNTPQRADVERTLAKAAVESNDLPRIVKYGESAAATSAEDYLLLDRLAFAFLSLGGEQNAAKAYKYARTFEDLVDKMPIATGKDAARRQDEQERAIGRALIYQARARTMQNDHADALRLVSRAFSAWPSEETAREWAEVSLRASQRPEAVEHLAEAFVIPDPYTTDDKRQGIGCCWASSTPPCTGPRRVWAI